MGLVLVVSLGLVALRSGSTDWAGVLFMVTCGALGLAIVGSVFGADADRAWWLGFAIFGIGYLVQVFSWLPIFIDAPAFPTETWLNLAKPYIGPPPGWLPGAHENPYPQAGHCLFGLVAALIGGVLAKALFRGPSKGLSPVRTSTCRPSFRIPLAMLAGLALFAVMAIAGARRAPGLWAGMTVLVTWGLLGLTSVAALCGQGRRRAACLGASLFGIGYMLLVAGMPLAVLIDVNRQPWPQFAVNRLLVAVRSWIPTVVGEYPAGSPAVALANSRILQVLDRSIPMRFPSGTPLRDVLAYVATATRSPDGYEIPLYLDPNSIEDQEKALGTPVRMNLEGVPLRTTMELALDQCSLCYTLKGGAIVVNKYNDDPDQIPLASNDPFLGIAHSLLAMLAAGLGGMLASLISAPQSKTDGSTTSGVSGTP
jgi:hypothetical protein